jgi:predicted transposase/invertase (TIGR01784 family)
MSYDNTCKFLAETFTADIATWLLGEPVNLTKMEPSELSVEPIRADALILLESDDLVVHIEFQTDPDRDMPFRSADYRLRFYRRAPHKEVRQVVIYLRPNRSPLVYETSFQLTRTRHDFDAIRLWEQPTEVFLRSPGLLPFAVLSQTDDKTSVLQTVANEIESITDRKDQRNIAASASLLAGLVMDKDIIQRVLRNDIMRESVIYQEIEKEASAGASAGASARST